VLRLTGRNWAESYSSFGAAPTLACFVDSSHPKSGGLKLDSWKQDARLQHTFSCADEHV
jgi:hypothetical protein